VRINTFFYKCKDAGIEIQTEETRKIERYTKAQMMHGFKSDAEINESVNKLGNQDGIDPKITQEIINLPFGIPPGITPVISRTLPGPASMFLEYQIISGSNQRTGTIVANFNSLGTPSSTYYETVTADIGNTTMISFLTEGTPPYDILANNSGPTPFSFKAILRYF
jgi:hypothetical protein